MQLTTLLLLSVFYQSTSLQETAEELQKITVPSADLVFPFAIDPQAAKLLPIYKRQIRQSLEATLNKTSINAINSAKLLASLPIVDKSAYYGRISRIEILRPKLNPELLGLVVDIHVVQEPDSFFVLYQRARNQWRAIYEWDESTYTSTNMDLWHLKTPQLIPGNAAKKLPAPR